MIRSKGEDRRHGLRGWTRGKNIQLNFHYFSAGYPCTIYEKCCKGRYSLNRMTEETFHEKRPLFGTENKIFQDIRDYT